MPKNPLTSFFTDRLKGHTPFRFKIWYKQETPKKVKQKCKRLKNRKERRRCQKRSPTPRRKRKKQKQKCRAARKRRKPAEPNYPYWKISNIFPIKPSTQLMKHLYQDGCSEENSSVNLQEEDEDMDSDIESDLEVGDVEFINDALYPNDPRRYINVYDDYSDSESDYSDDGSSTRIGGQCLGVCHRQFRGDFSREKSCTSQYLRTFKKCFSRSYKTWRKKAKGTHTPKCEKPKLFRPTTQWELEELENNPELLDYVDMSAFNEDYMDDESDEDEIRKMPYCVGLIEQRCKAAVPLPTPTRSHVEDDDSDVDPTDDPHFDLYHYIATENERKRRLRRQRMRLTYQPPVPFSKRMCETLPKSKLVQSKKKQDGGFFPKMPHPDKSEKVYTPHSELFAYQWWTRHPLHMAKYFLQTRKQRHGKKHWLSNPWNDLENESLRRLPHLSMKVEHLPLDVLRRVYPARFKLLQEKCKLDVPEQECPPLELEEKPSKNVRFCNDLDYSDNYRIPMPSNKCPPKKKLKSILPYRSMSRCSLHDPRELVPHLAKNGDETPPPVSNSNYGTCNFPDSESLLFSHDGLPCKKLSPDATKPFSQYDVEPDAPIIIQPPVGQNPMLLPLDVQETIEDFVDFTKSYINETCPDAYDLMVELKRMGKRIRRAVTAKKALEYLKRKLCQIPVYRRMKAKLPQSCDVNFLLNRIKNFVSTSWEIISLEPLEPRPGTSATSTSSQKMSSSTPWNPFSYLWQSLTGSQPYTSNYDEEYSSESSESSEDTDSSECTDSSKTTDTTDTESTDLEQSPFYHVTTPSELKAVIDENHMICKSVTDLKALLMSPLSQSISEEELDHLLVSYTRSDSEK